MPEQFLHGVEVVELTTGVRPIRTVKSSVIGLVGTAPRADAAAFPLDTPVLVTTPGEAAALLKNAADAGGDGTLPAALDAIFDQAGAAVVVIRVDVGADDAATQANVKGGVDGATGQYTGVHALLGAQSALGVTPKILVATGFTHQRAAGAANPVGAELVGIADKLRAVVIVDGPNTTDADAQDYAGDYSSPRVYIVDPFINGQGASAAVAGLIAKSDNDRGFWWSPSNQGINGVVTLGRPVDFKLGDANSRANLLNEANVATVIREDGFRLWGNRTASGDFLSVQRTKDMIHESLLRAHLWAVDRNITRTYVADVVEGVNGYLRSLTAMGAIIGGKCWADPDLNSPANIAAGKVYFNFDFTPPYPAEHVVFQSFLTTDYLKELV